MALLRKVNMPVFNCFHWETVTKSNPETPQKQKKRKRNKKKKTFGKRKK